MNLPVASTALIFSFWTKRHLAQVTTFPLVNNNTFSFQDMILPFKIQCKASATTLLLCLGIAWGFVFPSSGRGNRSLLIRKPVNIFSQKHFDVMGEVDDFVEPVSRPVRGSKRRALKRALLKILDSAAIEGEEGDDQLTEAQRGSRVFDSIDVDGDGILDKDELYKVGLNLAELNAINVNRDGSIDREEFERALSTLEGMLPTTTGTGEKTEQSIADEIDETLGDLEPLERQELRLGGFEPYILVAVLTAQASFEEIADLEVDWKGFIDIASIQDFWNADWYTVGVLISAGLSTVAGIYATVVFSLTILYGKTALGMDRDDDYYSFMDNTGLQRFRAFQAFTYGLFTFSISVLLEICTKCPELLRFPCAFVSGLSLVYAKKEYDVIMAAAAPMFAPKNPPTPVDKEENSGDKNEAANENKADKNGDKVDQTD